MSAGCSGGAARRASRLCKPHLEILMRLWSAGTVNIPNYQEIMELLREGRTLEAREKILELREAALKLQEENLGLRQRLQHLEGDAGQYRNMHFEKGVYWLRTPTDDGTNLVGPFCQVCYDRDLRPVRLHRDSTPGGGWHCAVCRNHF